LCCQFEELEASFFSALEALHYRSEVKLAFSSDGCSIDVCCQVFKGVVRKILQFHKSQKALTRSQKKHSSFQAMMTMKAMDLRNDRHRCLLASLFSPRVVNARPRIVCSRIAACVALLFRALCVDEFRDCCT